MKRFLAFIGIPVVGFTGFQYYLRKKYPYVDLSQLPSEMQMASAIPPEGEYIAYTDSYKARMSGKSSEEILGRFLVSRPLKYVFKDNSPFTTNKKVSISPNASCLFWKWTFADEGMEVFFEKASRYGYPWRMLHGGFQELYVVPVAGQNGYYDVYYSSSHFYKDLNDAKILPKWSIGMHRLYARLILWCNDKP